MACAFGMEACKQQYKTQYVRLPDLLMELEMARTNGSYVKVQKKYASPILLIIDEWLLLLKPTESEQHDILELLHRRRKRSSTIFCSQYEDTGWYDQLGGDDSPLAETIFIPMYFNCKNSNFFPSDHNQTHSIRFCQGVHGHICLLHFAKESDCRFLRFRDHSISKSTDLKLL